MKRIVVLIDGTWDKEGTSGDTNVAKLDCGQRMPVKAFIKAVATDGAVQNVHYHDGVGTEGNALVRGLGLVPAVHSARSLVFRSTRRSSLSNSRFASRALALSTAARTNQSLPSRVTDVVPNFPTRKRPTASGESELTRASSRSFMGMSSGRG